MTETTTDTPQFTDHMHQMVHEQLEGFIKERNSLVGTANAAHGDRVTLTEQIREESTDPEIVAAREAYSEALLALDALVKPKVDAIIANATESVAEVEAKIKEIDSKLKPGLSYYKKLYGDEVAATLPAQAKIKGLRVASASGGRRIRGFNFVVTVDGESQEFENAASAAKWLDVETGSFQEAFFEAAGNPKQVKDAPANVDFQIVFVEVDEDENETEKTAKVAAYRPDATDAPEVEAEAPAEA